MMNETLKEDAIDRLYKEILPLIETSSNREEFGENVFFISNQAREDWNSLDQLDKNIFLSIVKSILEDRYGKPDTQTSFSM